MGTRSKKASRRDRQKQKTVARFLTLKDIEQLWHRTADKHSTGAPKVFLDYGEMQMAFDRAVFSALPRATLMRHPYKGEIPPERVDQHQYRKDIAARRLQLVSVMCPLPEDSGCRHKEVKMMEPDNFLYEPLSKGQCVLLGENPDGAIVYGLLHQRLPLELIQTGITPY